MFAVLGESYVSAGMLAAVVMCAGLLRGFAGFGSSLLIVPVLGFSIGPTVAVAIATMLEGVATMLLLPASLKRADRRMMLIMSPCAAMAIPAGHALLVSLDPTLSNIAISGAVLTMTALIVAGARLPLRHSSAGHAVAGGLQGFFTGFGGVGGPPLVLYILAGEASPATKRASIITVSSISLSIALFSTAHFGLLTREALQGAAVLTPAFLLGGVAGSYLFRMAGDRFFQRVALTGLMLAVLALFTANLTRALS
ncbi:sulfite exporter TauE/SafE family protein [Pikeienuella piscinae]|uniref:Probable membrane transporter protein n=1 Tax=Pikeienuella piscinae TaxID=2748098 RepID=A0A7L5C0H1_9RHOB|nr:sulfite exporter TauE/SafE family protein [Pikeienuella piscinae]QIE56016.1 sulfite exporter TauE/SafE family protein [Pikeienuella piscinae]